MQKNRLINKIGFNIAIKTMLLILSLVLVYHVLIVSQLIPYEAVWGGRLTSISQMYRFETTSIIINIFILLILLIKGTFIRISLPTRLINSLLVLFSLLFALNTIGNIFSSNIWEAIIFTPITLMASILCYRIAIEKE